MVDAIGFVAGSLVLATFLMRSLRALRMTAIASNFAFLTFEYMAGVDPVLVLHAALLPINLWRLAELEKQSFDDRSYSVNGR